MKKFTVMCLSGVMAVCLTGCENMSNQDVGVVSGGVLGGLAGSHFGHGSGRFAATVGGAVVGSLLGSAIGKSMDDVDKMKVEKALETTPTNRKYEWSNPDNGHRYSVTPTETYRSRGHACRKYVTEAWIDGVRQQIHGTACRNDQGKWLAMN